MIRYTENISIVTKSNAPGTTEARETYGRLCDCVFILLAQPSTPVVFVRVKIQQLNRPASVTFRTLLGSSLSEMSQPLLESPSPHRSRAATTLATFPTSTTVSSPAASKLHISREEF